MKKIENKKIFEKEKSTLILGRRKKDERKKRADKNKF